MLFTRAYRRSSDCNAILYLVQKYYQVRPVSVITALQNTVQKKIARADKNDNICTPRNECDRSTGSRPRSALHGRCKHSAVGIPQKLLVSIPKLQPAISPRPSFLMTSCLQKTGLAAGSRPYFYCEIMQSKCRWPPLSSLRGPAM